MWFALIVMGAEYLWHRYMEPHSVPKPEQTTTIPLVSRSSTIPLIYGKCRVTMPILAYTSTPIVETLADDRGFLYQLDMLMVFGIPFQSGLQRLVQAYVGERRMQQFGSFFLSSQTGNGNFEGAISHVSLAVPTSTLDVDNGAIEFLNGRSMQTLVNPTTGTPTTEAGRYMTSTELLDPTDNQPWNHAVGKLDPFAVPGYRGYISGFLWNEFEQQHWAVGKTPTVNAYSYEVSSYPAGEGVLGLGTNDGSFDVNPIDVILDLLTGTFGKLAQPLTYIDMPNFYSAANVLRQERNYMSIAFQQQQTAEEMLKVALMQIDGLLYEDPATGLLRIKLIRPDYDAATMLIISPDNCVELQNFAAGGWTDVTNRVVVTFTNRDNAYKQGSAVAFSQANAVGQDGEVREVTVNYPGVTQQWLADNIASRELSARSRPLMKCRAIVNRSFFRIAPGDAVKLSWPEANVNGVIMRVAGISYGTLESNAMALDLIQDYFYTHRNFTQYTVPPIDVRALVEQF